MQSFKGIPVSPGIAIGKAVGSDYLVIGSVATLALRQPADVWTSW